MRKGVVIILLAAVTAATWAQSGKEAKSETLLRWHFVGTKHLASLKDLKTMNEVLALPETRALQEAAAQGLAGRAALRFNKSGNTNANAELVGLIQPLLPDLWQNESRFHMGTKGADAAEWMIAVKLPENRSLEWNKTLAELTRHAGMGGAKAGEEKGWTAQRDNYQLTLSKSKDWLVVQGGNGAPDEKVAKEFIGSLGKRRGKGLLEAEVNSPSLGKIWEAPRLAHAPRLLVSAEPKKDGVHSEVLVEYPQDLEIKVEKWNVPTDLVREPLIGFTAIRGIGERLAKNKNFQDLGAKQTPNQLFVWAQSSTPFSISMAAEVKNPGEVITNAARAFEHAKLPAGRLLLATNRTALLWRGLPIAVPFLEVAPAPYEGFIRGGLFPIQAPGRDNVPAPKELFAQLNKKNLVYYDWEMTGERLSQWIPLWQLRYLLSGPVVPNNTAASSKWLLALGSRVGNTVTEGTLDNKRRVKMVRQSGLGFNALELLAIAHWIDSGDLMEVGSRKRTQPQNNVPAPGLP